MILLNRSIFFPLEYGIYRSISVTFFTRGHRNVSVTYRGPKKMRKGSREARDDVVI